MVLAPAYDKKCPLHALVLKTDVTLVQTLRLIILDFFYRKFILQWSAHVSWCNNLTIKTRCGWTDTCKKQLLNLFCIVYYIFLEGKSPARKCDVIKNSSDVIKVSSSSNPKGSGTVEFFLKNRFQLNKICIEPKYTLQTIALFLNWNPFIV